MKLSRQSLKENAWQEKGFILPSFDIEEITENTNKKPTWIHFGVGNIFRAFPAVCMQKLLNERASNTGIIGVGVSLKSFDNLTCSVSLKSDGRMENTIVASITETLTIDEDFARMKEIFMADSIQMVSFTITEKGYVVSEDPKAALRVLAELLYERFQENKPAIALVSMDNCANNGDLLKKIMLRTAQKYYDESFANYLKNLSFPITMIDKITPRPSEIVGNKLKELGYEVKATIFDSFGAPVSSFVNAEESEYLVIEDIFPNGRPPLEKAGVVFTDRETVESIEKMKVGACLNPLHTIIAIFGSLLSIEFVHEAMKNEALVNLIKECGYNESLPFVPDPGVISPKAFIDEVLQKRFPNPFIPDEPSRIATDTSLKVPIRFGEVLKTMQNRGKDITELSAIPFFVAGWFRYLTKINEEGNSFTPSPDPNLQELTSIFEGIKLGDELPIDAIGLLRRSDIFGINIISLASKIKTYFDELNKEKGSIQNTLNKYWL